MIKKIFNIFKTITILFALFINIKNVYKLDFKNIFNIEIFTLCIMFILFYGIVKKDENKSSISTKLLSFLFSFIFIFGNSYKLANSWKLIFGSILNIIVSIIMFIGYYILFSYTLKKIHIFLDNYKNNNILINNRVLKIFNNHTFLFSLFTILFCWLIYIIAFYPIILSPDPSFQIKQFFGEYTKYMDYIIPIDKNITITNHHPVIHTFLLGICVKLGTIINNDNLGFFLYSIIQILILSSTLSYVIYYMKSIKTNKKIIKITLIIFSLTPVYALYSMSAVKDVIFTSIFILFNILIFDINKNNKFKLKKIFILMILIMLLVLFRNNGIYIVLITLTFMLTNNILRKKILIIILFTLLFNYSYNNILLPNMKISAGSIREVLSIPFQQTARYVKYNYSSLDSGEKEAIDKVLELDTLADRYEEEISDPVKNKFNKNANKNDLKKYFIAWFKGFKKNPETYIESTLNNVYGYFYPNKTRWYVYYNYYNILEENNIDYHYNKLSNLRNILSNYAIIFPYIPILGLIVNIGFNTLILLFMCIYLITKRKNIIFLIPSLTVLMVCIASPVNAYFRYAMPYIFSMPLLISMFLHKIND